MADIQQSTPRTRQRPMVLDLPPAKQFLMNCVERAQLLIRGRSFSFPRPRTPVR
jgi:hypothetical protein